MRGQGNPESDHLLRNRNLLLKVSEDGKVDEEIELPKEVASEAIRRELEIIGNTLGDIHDRLSEINGNIIRGEFACPFCGKEGCEHYWTERKKCKTHDDGE